jgi:hypothetical protein
MVNKGLKANDLVQRAEALIDIEMLECPSQDARYQEIIREFVRNISTVLFYGR